MDGQLIVAFMENAALLLAMVVIFELLAVDRSMRNRSAAAVAAGVAAGLVAIVTMLNAWPFSPGIMFDTRSVVLGICGLFFGAVPTAIAMTMSGAARLYLGGDAAVTGTLVILASGMIGIAWRRLRTGSLADASLAEFYFFGLAVHGVMLALMLTMPASTAIEVLSRISLPVLVVYPGLTLVIAALFRNRLRGERDREALARNEERLRLATASAGQGLYDLDIETGRITVNEQYARLLGYDPASFHESLEAWTERLHPDDREDALASYRGYVEGRLPEYRVECRLRNADGAWIWILSAGSIVARDASGRARRMTGTNTDITPLKKAEDAAESARREADRLLESANQSRRALLSLSEDLRGSNARFRKLFNLAPVPLFHVDRRGRLLDFNDRFFQTFGYTPEDIPSLEQWWETAYPDPSYRARVRSVWDAAVRKTSASGKVIGAAENRVRCADGRILDVIVSVVDDGENLLGAFFDITDRKRAERALRASRNELRATINAVPDLLFDVSAKGDVHAFHSSHPELLASDPDTIVGRTIDDLLPNEAVETVREAIDEALRTGDSKGRRYRLVLSGREHWFELSVARKPSSGSATPRFIALARDITERTNAERALRDRERQLSTLIGNLPGAVYRCLDDQHFSLEFISSGIESLSGHSVEALLRGEVTCLGLIHPDDRKMVEREIRVALARKSPFEVAYRLITSSGEERWVLERGASTGARADGRRIIEGYIADISDRMVAENLRALQAQRAEALLELPRIAEEADERTFVESCVEIVEQLTGSSAAFACFVGDDQQPEPVILSCAPSDGTGGMSGVARDRLVRSDLIASAVREKRPILVNNAASRTRANVDGEGVSRAIAAPVVDEGGVVMVAGAFDAGRDYAPSDVETVQLVANEMWRTLQRRRARLELDKLSQAVEQSSESIVITNLDGEIEYVNEAFERVTGYRRDEVIGANPSVLQSGSTPASTYEELWQALGAGRPWKGEFYNRRKDGSEYVEFAIVSPLRQRDGRVTHYVAVKEDITEKKRVGEELDRHRYHLEELVVERTRQLAVARARAEAANRAKSEFLANMSHEIRTPMNAIIGLTHLLKSSVSDPANAEKLVQIDTAAEHLLRIIDDILDLSKIEAGKLTLEHTDFLLVEILEEIRGLIVERAAEKGLDVVIESDGADIAVRGDPTRLRQAMLNLAGNAVKFTDRGRVVLRARLVDEFDGRVQLCFEVEDTGIGIPADTLATLFQAFQQADATTTRKYGGTGLGLAITARLAGLMGGKVSAESEPGRGSTFRFTAWLERGDAISTTHAESNPADASLELERHYSKARLLLVEDDEVSREVALELLESVGLDADPAANGHEAVELARRNAYDLVLMDVQMPGMDGLEATRHIRELPGFESVPILALTANVFEDDRRACLAAGMNDFVSKPVDPNTLFDRLLEWLSRDDLTQAAS